MIQIIYKKVVRNLTVLFAHGRLIWMIQIIYKKVFRNLTVLFAFASKSAQNIVKTSVCDLISLIYALLDFCSK